MNGVEIRLGTPADEEALAALRAALWPDGSVEEHRSEVRSVLNGQLSTLPLVVLVAEHEHEVVGFAEVGLRSHADGCDPRRPCGFLEGWYVKPSHARQGIGRALVERAEDWTRQQGCVEFASDTWLDNETSQRAHEALGFEVVDRAVNYRKALALNAPPSDGGRDDTGFYGRDLAHVHHRYYGSVAESAAAEVLRRLEGAGVSSGLVVDLGCGGGIMGRLMSDAGFDLLGVDISAEGLALASQHVPGARFVHDSVWTCDVPPSVAVTAVGEVFCYETGGTPPDLAQLERRLAAIRRALAPGGLLLMDVAGPGRSGATGTRHASWEKDGTVLYFEETEDASVNRLTRTIDTFIPQGGLYRRSHERHTLTLYAPDEVEAALGRAGFNVERLERYDTFRFLPGWYGFAATKGW